MSVSNDFECITKVVQLSEKSICVELAKVQRKLKICEAKLKEQDGTIQILKLCEAKIEEHNAKMQTLEQKLTVLENENKSLMEQITCLQVDKNIINIHSIHSGCRHLPLHSIVFYLTLNPM